MLERMKFTTHDPAKLVGDLNRYQQAVMEELRRIERERVKRYALGDQVNGPATMLAKFDTFHLVNPANGSVDILLPDANRSDVGRSLIVARMDASNTVTLRGGTRLINNDTVSSTIPTARAAYLVYWDGRGFWTVNDA